MARGKQGETSRPSPLYQRTAKALERILAEAEPGSTLPSEPALAKELGVSRATLREAMRTFEQRGMIVRRQGVGTYVTSPPQVIETGLEVLQSLEALAERSGLKVEMGDLEIKERTPDGEERRMLKVAEGATIVEVARVILAKGRPVAYLVDCVPEGMLPGEIQEGAFSGSVLDAFLRWGETELAFSRTEITAVAADPEVARHLRIQRGDVLLEFEAYLYTRDGRAVDHSCSFFLPGVFRFHILRRVGP